MEWLGLIAWASALPLALAGTLASPWLGLQSLPTLAGLTGCVLYIALEPGAGLAWASAGLAVVAIAAVAFGSMTLVSAEPRSTRPGQGAEEVAAALAGVELPAAGGGRVLDGLGGRGRDDGRLTAAVREVQNSPERISGSWLTYQPTSS